MFRLVMILMFLGSPLFGDWLVTVDGAKVETEGAWTVKGRQVVFTLPSGTLSSMRLSEVDLDKSASLTAEARKPKVKPPPPPPRKSVLKLTDADVAHVDPDSFPDPALESPDSAEGSATESGSDSGSSSASGQSTRIEVENWAQEESTARGGWIVTGTLRNTASGELRGVALSVHALDSEGEVMALAQADVASTVLALGGTTGFSAFFSGIEEPDNFDFRPISRLAKVKAPVPATATTESEGDEVDSQVDEEDEEDELDSLPTEGFDEEDLEE